MSKKERIASLERKAAHLADLIDIIVSQDPALLDRIDSIERQISHQDRKIDDLEKQIDDLETMIRHYIARVEEWKKQHPVAFTFHGGVRPLPTRASLQPKTTELTE